MNLKGDTLARWALAAVLILLGTRLDFRTIYLIAKYSLKIIMWPDRLSGNLGLDQFNINWANSG